MLEELLDHIIAKDIGHQLQRVLEDFVEQLRFLVTIR